MQRIRTVKPDLFHHEKLFLAETRSTLPIRLAFIGLFTCCDRKGCFKWRVNELRALIFPFDDINMQKVLECLRKQGFIKQYQVKKEKYGYIPSWSSHQVINARESQGHIPIPPGYRDPKDNKGVKKPLNKTTNEIIDRLFLHWKTTFNRPTAKLDQKRIDIVQTALDLGYTEQELCEAITGCAKTPHNMGNNKQGLVFDSLTLILRDADQIERFIKNNTPVTAIDPFMTSQSLAHEDHLKRWASEGNVKTIEKPSYQIKK